MDSCESAVMVGNIIAEFFFEKGVRHAFTISGAGDIRILDAIQTLGRTELISCHHEQSCAMAAIAYWRVCGVIAPVIVTCGGGAANVVTGIVSAWMDSIPLFVIAGQESRRNERLRAYGVQGFNLSRMVERQTKFSRWEPSLQGFRCAWDEMFRDRPGPVVLEVPMDLQ